MAGDELTALLQSWGPDAPAGLAADKPSKLDLQSILDSWDREKKSEQTESKQAEPLTDEKAPAMTWLANESDHEKELRQTKEQLQTVVEYLEELDEHRANEIEEKDAEFAINWAKEQGIIPDLDNDYLQLRFLAKMMNDDFFAEAWGNRGEEPGRLENMLRTYGEQITAEQDELIRKSDAGLAAAVHAAKSVINSSKDNSSLDFRKMTDAQYQEAKQKIFADAKAGKLR